MIIIGIDPGLTIGMALYDTDDETFDVFQSTDPVQIMDEIESLHQYYSTEADRVYVIEDYLSAGHMTKEAKYTLEVLGYFKHSLHYADLKVVTPQRRKPFVKKAAEMLGGGMELERDKDVKDGLSALAHCLAERASWD